MNKQEAIEKIEKILLLPTDDVGPSFDLGYNNGLRKAKSIIEQIEPEKPVVPQFVAEWIEKSKAEKRNLRNALNNGGEKMRLWFLGQENYDIFARAWLDGYEVEKEKQYTARLKVVTIKKAGYLNRHNKNGSIIIDTSYTAGGRYQVCSTHSELEELGIWDNPAFEIEEKEND